MSSTAKTRPLTFSAAPDNTWRDAYDPWRGMSVGRIIHLLESFPRGEFADFAWTLAAPITGVESRDADMLTLVDRRCAAILEMDWDIRTVSETRTAYDAALAAEQVAALREAYERITNLTEVFEHLTLATFHGYAFAEPIRDAARQITRFACVAPWNIIRDGTAGAWKYNPEATSTTFDALPAEFLIPEEEWLWRSCARPVGGISLVKWFREQITDRNWDAAQEIFSVPGGIIIMPPDCADDAKKNFLEAAKQIPRGGSCVLPAGASFSATSFPTEIVQLFTMRKKDLQERLILAGTGGILTTLAASTGLNSDASSTQADAYATLAAGDATRISESFQRLIDREVLARLFPGKPRLAYFRIASEDAEDTQSYIANVVALAGAGIEVDVEEIHEKTGYKLTRKETPQTPPNGGGFANTRKTADTPLNGTASGSHSPPASPIQSEPVARTAAPAAATLENLLSATAEKLSIAEREDWAPITAALETLADATTPEAYAAALEALREDLPALAEKVWAEGKSATVLADALQAAAEAGAKSAPALLNSRARVREGSEKPPSEGKQKQSNQARSDAETCATCRAAISAECAKTVPPLQNADGGCRSKDPSECSVHGGGKPTTPHPTEPKVLSQSQGAELCRKVSRIKTPSGKTKTIDGSVAKHFQQNGRLSDLRFAEHALTTIGTGAENTHTNRKGVLNDYSAQTFKGADDGKDLHLLVVSRPGKTGKVRSWMKVRNSERLKALLTGNEKDPPKGGSDTA
jgi:phage gp29-like protein